MPFVDHIKIVLFDFLFSSVQKEIKQHLSSFLNPPYFFYKLQFKSKCIHNRMNTYEFNDAVDVLGKIFFDGIFYGDVKVSCCVLFSEAVIKQIIVTFNHVLKSNNELIWINLHIF